MFPASTKGGGQCFAMPDTCLTPAPPAPPVPVPYPNISMPAQATGTSGKVKISCSETLTAGSSIPSSQGDEAGVNMGVASGMVMSSTEFKKYSDKVKAEGQGVVYHTSSTGQNGNSANQPAGAFVAPSQTKVMVG